MRVNFAGVRNVAEGREEYRFDFYLEIEAVDLSVTYGRLQEKWGNQRQLPGF